MHSHVGGSKLSNSRWKRGRDLHVIKAFYLVRGEEVRVISIPQIKWHEISRKYSAKLNTRKV